MTGRRMRSRVFSHMRAISITAFFGLVAFLALGNLAIFTAMVWAKTTAPAQNVQAPKGVENFQVVDDTVWRGSHPKDLRDLADRGVTTIVDLRAEEGLVVDEKLLRRVGITRFNIPLRDGQVPSQTQVDQFLEIVEHARGKVYVHCMAGVGRTGAMVGAYLVSTGQLNGAGALRRNLAVGTPSLEQVTFVAGMGTSDITKPPVAVTALSRVIDAPRRIYHNLGF